MTLSLRPIFFRLSTFKLHRYPNDFSQEGIYYLRRVYNVHKYRYIPIFKCICFFFTSFRNSPVVFFLHSFRFVSLFHPCNIITICYYYYYSLLRARRFRRRANQFVSGFTRASSRHDFTVMSRPHCRYSKPEQFRAYNRI